MCLCQKLYYRRNAKKAEGFKLHLSSLIVAFSIVNIRDLEQKLSQQNERPHWVHFYFVIKSHKCVGVFGCDMSKCEKFDEVWILLWDVSHIYAAEGTFLHFKPNLQIFLQSRRYLWSIQCSCCSCCREEEASCRLLLKWWSTFLLLDSSIRALGK